MKLSFMVSFLLFCTVACMQKKEQPISKAEALAFADNIATSVKKHDKEVLDNVIEKDIFANEVVKLVGEEGDASLKSGIKQGLKNLNLGTQVYNSMGKNGLYEFLKEYEKDGHQHIIFRLYGDGGLNYHDFELVKFDNKISARDIYIYLTGENLTSTMAHLYSATIKQSNGSNSLANQYAKSLTELKSLTDQQKYTEAKSVFDRLPEALQKQKTFQLLNLQITSKLDNEIYTKALNEFEKLYAGDASAQLPLFDNYYLRGDYEKSLQVVDQIDKSVHDPLLDYHRALIYTQKKDSKTAITYLEKLYKNMPYFEAGVLELMANYIEAQRYKEANTLIASYKKNKNFNQDRLQDIKNLYPYESTSVNW